MDVAVSFWNKLKELMTEKDVYVLDKVKGELTEWEDELKKWIVDNVGKDQLVKFETAESVEKFKEVNEAYQVLSDPDKKRQYDQFGHAAFDGGAGGAGGFDFGGADFADIFGDIFGDLFGGGGSRRRSNNGPMQGANVRASVRITFEEAVFGCKKEIKIPNLGIFYFCNAFIISAKLSFTSPRASISEKCTCGHSRSQLIAGIVILK